MKILDCVCLSVCWPLVTVVNDVMVHEVLQEADSGGSVGSLLVAHDPVDQLLRHEAVGVCSQVVAPVLDQLPVVKPQPGVEFKQIRVAQVCVSRPGRW